MTVVASTIAGVQVTPPRAIAGGWTVRTALVVAGAVAAAVAFGRTTPAAWLAAGAVVGLACGSVFGRRGQKAGKLLLQGSVVLLGFTMDLPSVLRAGRDGAAFAAVTIAATLAGGYLVGQWLGIGQRVSTLISSGTAICGGSAIAAVGAAVRAVEAELAVALGAVFVLNAVALYVFPPVGTALGLTQVQFGTWAGVAIHDVSAVVAASARYGDEAMRVATAVKLSRTLWILPVAAVAAYLCRDRGTTADGGGAATPARKATAAVPWFIGVFLLASAGRTLVPAIGNVAPTIATVAKAGLAMTLFLVGTSLSVQCLRTVGWRPLVQAAVLWASISGASLAAVVVMW